MALTITLDVVGVVHSPFSEVDDERDWADVESEIHVDPAFVPGLQGIGDYADIVVVYYLHKSQFDSATDLVQRQSARADAPARGIFALRTYHRPNGISSTTVRLLAVAGNLLRVKGLDALDGTPVLDLKPYAPPTPKRATAPMPRVMPEI